jgi:hypothetical protein
MSMETMSSVEMMESWYGRSPEASAEWEDLLKAFESNGLQLLDTLLFGAINLGTDVKEKLRTIFLHAGGQALTDLSVEAENMIIPLREQLAAEELHTRFGVAQSLLALPVETELARREVEANVAVRAIGVHMFELLSRNSDQLVPAIQETVDGRVAEIEVEIDSHRQAKAKAAEIAATHSEELNPIVDPARPKFDQKEKDLIAERKELQETLLRIEEGIGTIMAKSKPTIIFAANQSTAPIRLAA